MQRIARTRRRCLWAATGLLLALTSNASAQVIPFSGTVEYRAENDTSSSVTVKAANGSPAYVLTLQTERNIEGHLSNIDLVMRRPGAPLDTPNLLDPPYRWHGLQEYMFTADDFIDGPDKSIYTRVRTLLIKRRKLNVTITVSGVEIAPADPHVSNSQNNVFKRLVLGVMVDNMK